VDGTAAVTGFTIPVGFAGGSFTIIPDGNFTWTTAGNIGLAGTAVTGRALTFLYDTNAAKFWPSYV
jgi:DNA-binding beta-propeller fold protein YncE